MDRAGGGLGTLQSRIEASVGETQAFCLDINRSGL